MDRDDHALAIGKIVGNPQALELLVRLFLCEVNGDKIEFPADAPSSMKETYLTNYASLGKVICTYNGRLTSAEASFSIDNMVVRIRDSIAHGRLMSLSPHCPLTLYKFGKPKSGLAAVELAETLTESWLAANRILIRQQMDKVVSCGDARGYKSLA